MKFKQIILLFTFFLSGYAFHFVLSKTNTTYLSKTGEISDNTKRSSIKREITYNKQKGDPPIFTDEKFKDFSIYFNELVNSDRNKALEILEEYRVGGNQENIVLMHSFFGYSLAKDNPEKAIAWAQEIKDSSLSNAILSNVFDSLSRSNSTKTLELIGPYIEKKWAGSVISTALESLAKESSEKAFDWIDTHLKNQPGKYNNAIASILVSVGEKDASQMLALINRYDFGSKSEDIIRSSIYGLSTRSIESSLKLLSDIGENTPYRDAAIEGIVSANLERSPDEITAQVIKKSGPKAGEILAHGVVEWFGNDFPSATKWLDSQPLDLQKEILKHGLFGTAASVSPLETIKMVQRMEYTDDETAFHYREIIEPWGEANPTASLEWISTLKPEYQRKLITQYVDSLAQADASLIPKFLDSQKLDSEALRVGYERYNFMHAPRVRKSLNVK